VASVFGAFGALAALYHRSIEGTGEGQVIDVSLYEPLFRLVESQVIGFDQLGVIKERLPGNRLEEDSPRNTYETKDGQWVAISASSPRTWRRLCEALERVDLVDDPRFVDNLSRVENADELDAIVAQWFRHTSLDEAMEILRAHDVVAGPVYSIADIFKDPHYAAREDIVNVPDEDFGFVKMQAAFPKFSKTPGRIVHSGRDLGADNDAIYREWLGLTEEEMTELRADKVI
jgi:crotonobetainyl-CoA:carnitine CoA-transferase CaiB-like acyl-CoA transferase